MTDKGVSKRRRTAHFEEGSTPVDAAPRRHSTEGQARWRGSNKTPYQKTPASRSLRRGRHISRLERSPSVSEPDFSGILKKTWRAYRVSPLYNIKKTPEYFRHYGRQLSLFVKAEQHKGTGLVNTREQTDLATFSVYDGLNSEGDAIQVTLKQKVKGSQQENVVLTALLCCVQPVEGITTEVKDPFTLLPLMIIKGPTTLSKFLTSWMQAQFDCCISAQTFTAINLSWLVAMWAGNVPETTGRQKNRAVQLVYQTPSEVEGLTHITLEVEADDCHTIWKVIHPDEDVEFQAAEVATFMKSLEGHFYHFFRIQLDAMQLVRVGSASAYISFDGRVKIFDKDSVISVLAHLTEMTLEKSILWSS